MNPKFASKKGPECIKLLDVRLSYPDLYRAKAFNKDQEPKFGACFIIDKTKQADQILAIREVATLVAEKKWGKNVPKGIKTCLRKGDEEAKEGVDGYGPEVMFITSSSRKKPQTVGRDPRVPLSEDSGVLYPGCYVNALVTIWAQDNDFGKRINAQIDVVQFVRDGAAFGEAPVKAEEEFDVLEESAEDGGEGGGLLG